MTCDVGRTPVEGALSYGETSSTVHHGRLQHLLPTCAENKFHFQTLCFFFFFFSVGPPPQPLIALIVYTSLYYTQAVGRGGKVKEHHLVSEFNRDKDPLHIIPSICLLHARYSPSNWQWWVICFQCPFLKFTLAPNALSLWLVQLLYFSSGMKKKGGGGLPHTNDLWVIMIHVENLS